MTIRSTGSMQEWDRHRWASANRDVQDWVNAVVWRTLAGPGGELVVPPATGLPPETFENLREVILHNRLEGLVLAVWGDKLKDACGAAFYERMHEARRLTDLFLQEVHWLMGPRLGMQTMLIDDFAMRPHYRRLAAGEEQNPRLIHWLTLWTPTLATREEVIRMLGESGFEPDKGPEDAYVFRKLTGGHPHQIHLRGTIWNASKNWALDVEREIWDRALAYSSSVPLRLEITDLFLFAVRRFSIDSLCGGALCLRDMVTLAEGAVDELDWTRIRKIKNAFHKPDWLWGAFVALAAYEAKTGRRLALPDWVRESIEKADSFWTDFVTSRLNWSNPDLRLIDFPRAHVKAARGT